jgi:Anti-sigma factor NepR
MQPDPDAPNGLPGLATEAEDKPQMNAQTNSPHGVEPDLDVKLDAYTQTLIGQKLKAIYREIVQEPVPETFLKLLDELERKERRQ